MNQFTMAPHVRMMKSDQTLIGDFPLGNSKHPAMPMSRPSFHELLYDYARELGIPVALGKSVVEYFEDGGRGGVTYADGAKETADVVVAADGVGSRAWVLVTGEKQAATPSGFSVHLATYPTERALANPVVKEGFGDLESGVMFNLGPGAHFVIGKSPKETTWCLITRVRGQLLLLLLPPSSSSDANAVCQTTGPTRRDGRLGQQGLRRSRAGRDGELGALLQGARQDGARRRHSDLAPHVARPSAQVRLAARPRRTDRRRCTPLPAHFGCGSEYGAGGRLQPGVVPAVEREE